MNLADRYRIYIKENDIRPSSRRFAIADAMDYLQEANLLQIREEAARLLGIKDICESCAKNNMLLMEKAGLVKAEQQPGQGRPFIYTAVED